MTQIQIARHLWDKLWEDYSRRVSYARVYQQMIADAGGTLANDHIAFRSLGVTLSTAKEKVNLGIDFLSRIAEALGYAAAGEYTFPEQHLYARHYRHPEQDRFDLPKLFISELLVDRLPAPVAGLIYQTVLSGAERIAAAQHMPSLIETASSEADAEPIVTGLRSVLSRPWEPPVRAVVEEVNKVSQYGAWVLLHGYAVNHFTGYINRQNTPQYPDIESTARGLAELGVPMKAEIEGSRGSGLRQTATRAVTEMVPVRNHASNQLVSIPWTYAYYEIAERNFVEVAPGQTALFDAFLGAQAGNLFEMTRKIT